MPRYRVIKPVPDSITYRDGVVYFQDYYAGGKEWVWYVRREVVQSRAIDLCRADGADGLEALRKTGVTVRPGSSADEIFRSLVRRGYAEKLD